MSLHEPRRTHSADHTGRFLERLQREMTDRGHKTSSFSALCDMIALPRDLRAPLLKSLLGKGYVKLEGSDRLSITPVGTKLALSSSR